MLYIYIYTYIVTTWYNMYQLYLTMASFFTILTILCLYFRVVVLVFVSSVQLRLPLNFIIFKWINSNKFHQPNLVSLSPFSWDL